MAVQDDYILRTIRNLATAIGRLALGRDEVDYILPADESQDDGWRQSTGESVPWWRPDRLTRRKTSSLTR